MKSLAPARLKRVKALELAGKGHSYAQIAHEVGFTHRGSAHRAVWQALTEREAAAVDQLRALGLARLEMLLAALWQEAAAGDAVAGGRALRILQEENRLFGLYPKPRNGHPVDSGPRSMFVDDA